MKKIIILTLIVFSFSVVTINAKTGIFGHIDKIAEKDPNKLDNLKNYLQEVIEYIDKKQSLSKSNELKRYNVINVVDWDTIKIKYEWENTNIRLIGVDSPESYATRYWYKECYWEEASSFLNKLLKGKTIWIELDDTQWEKDSYWRLLAYVFYK